MYKIKFFRNFKVYIQSHLWYSFVLVFIVLLMLVFFMIQGYLRREYQRFIKEKTYTTRTAVLTAVGANMDRILTNIVQTSGKMAIADDLYTAVKKYEDGELGEVAANREFKRNLSRLAQESQWIENISIVSKQAVINQYDRRDNALLHFWNEDNIFYLNSIKNDLFQRIEAQEMPRYQTDSFFLVHPGDHAVSVFHISVPLIGNYGNINSVKYALVVTYNVKILGEPINAAFQGVDTWERGYVSNENDIIIWHPDSQLIGTNISDSANHDTLDNIQTEIGKFHWRLNISIDEEKMADQVDNIFTRSLAFVSVFLFSLLIISLLIRRLIFRPVNAIHQSISNVKMGRLDDKIEIEGNHEIWRLAGEYNLMLDAVALMQQQMEEHHQEKILQLKRMQAAEWLAMESQINAHFIYNVLGAINYELIEKGVHRPAVLIKKLSNILRYSFDQKNQSVFMLQEVAWTSQYLYLQKYRLGDVFDYEVHFTEGTEGWPCRKLILQPFVENSILHGFEGRESGGKIEVTGDVSGDFLKIEMKDNGCGMVPEIAEKVQGIIEGTVKLNDEEMGIGLFNVINRMRMYYGDNIKIAFKTAIGEGTCFTIYLPQPKS